MTLRWRVIGSNGHELASGLLDPSLPGSLPAVGEGQQLVVDGPRREPSTDARLAAAEERLDVHDEQIQALTDRRVQALAEILDAPAADPPLPSGVVPPHVRENLLRLAGWVKPGMQYAPGTPLSALMEHLHMLIGLALAGEDVPDPATVAERKL